VARGADPVSGGRGETMKFIVSMKDPDTLHDAITEAVESPDYDPKAFDGLDDDEIEEVKQKRIEKISKLCCDRWFKWGEYLRVEIDTEAKTCTVLPAD
jgi:hypothetical protein